MLSKEDLGQIREVVNDVVLPIVVASEKRVITTVIEAVGQMIHDNIVPQLDNIYQDIGELKADVKVLKEDMIEVKQDVSVLKQDVSVLKQDVSGLKQDVSVLKHDVSNLKHHVASIDAKMVTKGTLEDRFTDFRLSLAGTTV